MNMSPDILNELTALAPHLASMPRQVAFTVPEGYFIQLPDHLVALSAASSLPDPILSISKQGNMFTVPEGYFKQLPLNISVMAADSVVPEPVFTPGLSKQPFTTPHAYFGALSQNIMAIAKASEIPEPVLSHNEQLKNTPFEAPYLYFDKLPERILNRIHAAQPVSLWTRVKQAILSSGYTKMALGAVMMAVISIGAWTWYQPDHHYDNKGIAASTTADNTGELADNANIDEVYNNLTDEQINTVLANVNPADSSILNTMDLHDISLNDGASL